MRKILLLVLILPVIVQAQNTELQDMPEMTAIISTDVLYVVDDPGGTPDSQKITALNLFDMIDTFAELQAIVADKTLINEEDAITFDAIITFDTNIAFSDAATIDQSANNYIDFTENSDIFQFYFDGTDLGIIWSDGALNLQNAEDIDAIVNILGKDAGEKGILRVLSDGDDNYIELHHDDTDGHIITDTGDIHIEAAGGDILFDDDNVTTTGTVQGGSVSDGTATLTGGALTGLTTALTVAQGGTGATSLNDGFVLLGSNTAAITPLDVTTDGGIIIGDGTTDPVVLDVGSSTAITILGTIATGTWEATAIADGYIPNNITIDLATLATTVTVSDDENTDDEHEMVFTTDNTNLESDGDITYNPSTGELRVATNIVGEPKHLIFNIFNPLGVQTDDTQVCIWPVTPAALTVTKIVVTLDAAGNEVAGDLKWADTFIGLANATVINTFDTSSGVTSDDSITAGTVAAGKAMYIQYDSAPHTDITQMSVDITFDYD